MPGARKLQQGLAGGQLDASNRVGRGENTDTHLIPGQREMALGPERDVR